MNFIYVQFVYKPKFNTAVNFWEYFHSSLVLRNFLFPFPSSIKGLFCIFTLLAAKKSKFEGKRLDRGKRRLKQKTRLDKRAIQML